MLGDPGERGERGLSGEPVSHDVLREYNLLREHMESAIFGIVVQFPPLARIVWCFMHAVVSVPVRMHAVV